MSLQHRRRRSWPDGASWIALAQMRPTTAPTALPDDIVGTVRPGGEQPFLAAAFLDQQGVPGGRPGVDPRSPGAARDYPGDCDDRVIARDRAVDQPELRAHAEPSGPGIPEGSRRPDADGRGRHVPGAGRGAGAGPVAAGRRRHAAAQQVRQGDLRQPERAIGLPPARTDRRPGRQAARPADGPAVRQPRAARRLADGRGQRPLARGDRGRRERLGRAAAHYPADRRTASGPGR